MGKQEQRPESAPAIKAIPKFDLATLRKDCLKLFGVTSSTFDGAMSGKTGPYTVDEAKNIITGWGREAAK